MLISTIHSTNSHLALVFSLLPYFQGFDIIYEARDLDLPQSTRDGMTQARTNVEVTKARAKASEERIDADLEAFIKKNYWTEAREQLRRQVCCAQPALNE